MEEPGASCEMKLAVGIGLEQWAEEQRAVVNQVGGDDCKS